MGWLVRNNSGGKREKKDPGHSVGEKQHDKAKKRGGLVKNNERGTPRVGRIRHAPDGTLKKKTQTRIT